MHTSIRGLIYGAMMASTMALAAPADARQDTRARCDICGTVVTTNRKDEKGSGTAGTVIGGVGGAVVGNVAGHDTTATVLGGVGGAVAGNLIGKRMSTKKIWSVRVQMDNGGTQDVDFDRDPGFRQGQRVRMANGTLNRL